MNEDNVSLVVMINNNPLFVLIGVKSFTELQKPQERDERLSLLCLIDWAEKKKIAGPKYLIENHDKYLLENSEQEEK